MKLFPFVIAFIVLSCKNVPVPPGLASTIVHDTVIIRDTAFIEPLTSVGLPNCDSLKSALFAANYKLERVKYYLAIIKKNPSQAKWERGWLIRAIK